MKNEGLDVFVLVKVTQMKKLFSKTQTIISFLFQKNEATLSMKIVGSFGLFSRV